MQRDVTSQVEREELMVDAGARPVHGWSGEASHRGQRTPKRKNKTVIYRSPIEELADRLFDEYDPRGGDEIPVLGGVNWGGSSIIPLKRSAVTMLRAREWFAVEGGPSDAPPLPLAYHEIENYRQAGGLKRVIGFYTRSLEIQDFDYRKHPSFHDFARGLMALAMERGVWDLEKDASLIQRFPPLPLPGMIAEGSYWEPPKRQRRAA